MQQCKHSQCLSIALQAAPDSTRFTQCRISLFTISLLNLNLNLNLTISVQFRASRWKVLPLPLSAPSCCIPTQHAVGSCEQPQWQVACTPFLHTPAADPPHPPLSSPSPLLNLTLSPSPLSPPSQPADGQTVSLPPSHTPSATQPAKPTPPPPNSSHPSQQPCLLQKSRQPAKPTLTTSWPD